MKNNRFRWFTYGRKRIAFTFTIVPLFIHILSACGSPSIPAPPTAYEPGQLAKHEDVFGTFFTYMPTIIPENPEILALVHGTPPKVETAEANAEFYISSWIDFAEEQGTIQNDKGKAKAYQVRQVLKAIDRLEM